MNRGPRERQGTGALVGFAARNLGSLTWLADFTADPGEALRSQVYQAVATLYRMQGSLLGKRERVLMRDILQRLAPDVDLSVRATMAKKTADHPRAPLDLILLLIDDHIDLARPLILNSRQLVDAELLKLLPEWDVARRTVCAQRFHIGETLTDFLARDDCEPILVALACNMTARIGAASFVRLVEKARALRSLQEPLVHRPDLPSELAAEMCGWVSEELGFQLVRRYDLRPAASSHESEHLPASFQTRQDPESNFKLIEKLAIASQLKPGFLLRVLHQGQLETFELAFAKLLQIEHARLRRVLYEDSARNLAMACRAVGIDRSVFPTIYNLSCTARRIHPMLTPDDRASAEAVFNGYSKAEALTCLQTS